MDRNKFLQAIKLLNTHLINQIMDRTYNSVGSNIFFEFGEPQEILLQNGKKCLRKEWCIWLSWASWRITQYSKYMVGSGESIEINIQTFIEGLLGKRILSFQFISQFLDIEINFEDGYQVKTFFNQMIDDQWLVFLPDKTELMIDCSSKEEIKFIQNLSKQIEIQIGYRALDFSFLEAEVAELLFIENEISRIVCTKGFLIDLGLSAWRLLKNNQYQIGRKDYYFGCLEDQQKELEDILLNLVGKKLKYISIDPLGMDAKLEFDEEYSLELFIHAQLNQWKILQNNETVLSANTYILK